MSVLREYIHLFIKLTCLHKIQLGNAFKSAHKSTIFTVLPTPVILLSDCVLQLALWLVALSISHKMSLKVV